MRMSMTAHSESTQEASGCLFKFMIECGARCMSRLLLKNNSKINRYGKYISPPPIPLADSSAKPVADYRALGNCPRAHKSESGGGKEILAAYKAKKRGFNVLSPRKKKLKIARRGQTMHSIHYTDSRLLPFARRLASTRRPDVVWVRLKNPCARFRFRFDG